MAMLETFIDLYDYLALCLNFDPAAGNQDFTAAQLRQALNLAYQREYNKMIQEGLQPYFLATQNFTWVADDVTMKAPAFVTKGATINWRDVTDDDELIEGHNAPIVWDDRNTLRWTQTAPTSDRTIRVQYMAQPLKLVNDMDEPELVPPTYREVIVWGAATELRLIADKEPPVAWERRLQDMRFDMYKHISRGRPYSDIPMVTPLADSYQNVWTFGQGTGIL